MNANKLQSNTMFKTGGESMDELKMKIEELRVDGKSIDKVTKGTIFTIMSNEKIRPSDKLYKLVS